MTASSYSEYYGGLPGARSGLVNLALFIGDDYLVSNNRNLTWTTSIPSGTTIAGSEVELTFVQGSGACTPFEITFTGTITAAASAGYAVVSFEMAAALTATIPVGEYTWFVTWIGDDEERITKIYNRQLVNWKEQEAA